MTFRHLLLTALVVLPSVASATRDGRGHAKEGHIAAGERVEMELGYYTMMTDQDRVYYDLGGARSDLRLVVYRQFVDPFSDDPPPARERVCRTEGGRSVQRCEVTADAFAEVTVIIENIGSRSTPYTLNIDY